ncbi:hypothetical protein ACEWY4_017139 [Coilia grayii]|uniref:Ig-like domain-containing protein n=1 Tax=Coilia grayii TaxID=363190 RepID=A0ABD1JHF6_9TELE
MKTPFGGEGLVLSRFWFVVCERGCWNSDTTMGSSPSKPQLKDISVKRGDAIAFTWTANCAVNGTWKKDGQVLTNSAASSTSKRDDQAPEGGGRISIRHEDYKQFHLTIRDATEQDEGTYTLELSNWLGAASGSANVKLLEYDSDWRNLDWGDTENMKRKLGRFTLSNAQIGHLRFLLHGPVGYGKSSIINSFNSVFQRRVTDKALTAARSETSHTIVYKTYPIKDNQGRVLPFVFNDSMGLENEEEGKGGALTADIISALKGHVKDGYKFNKGSPLCEGDLGYNGNPNLSDKVHCLVSVIHADRISGLVEANSNIMKKMRDVRRAASDMGIPQVVIMTHVDECCPLVAKDLKHIYSSKKMKQAMQHCSNKLGVPMKCIFPVKNYHEEKEVDKKTDCLILDALQKIVHFANDYVEDK